MSTRRTAGQPRFLGQIGQSMALQTHQSGLHRLVTGEHSIERIHDAVIASTVAGVAVSLGFRDGYGLDFAFTVIAEPELGSAAILIGFPAPQRAAGAMDLDGAIAVEGGDSQEDVGARLWGWRVQAVEG